MISCLSLAKDLIRKEISALESLHDRIGPEFEQAVLCLSRDRGKVIATGLGKSGIIAGKISATLSSTGTPSIFIHPVEALHGDLGIIQRGDLGLFLSNSGETARGASVPSNIQAAGPQNYSYGWKSEFHSCQGL